MSGSISKSKFAKSSLHLFLMVFLSRKRPFLSSLFMKILSITLSSGQSDSSWWIKLIPKSLATLVSVMSTFLPSTNISPLSLANTPDKIFIRVDLPAPFSPTRAWISPSPTVKSTPIKTSFFPKDLYMFFISTFMTCS